MVSVPIDIRVHLPEGLDATDFDRKPVMAAIAGAAKDIRQLARRKMASRNSRPYPAKVSGLMQRSVKVHKAKRKDKLWARTQIDSFPGKFWYPAPLFYGSDKHNIRAFESPIVDAGDELSGKNLTAIQNAIDSALKGW